MRAVRIALAAAGLGCFALAARLLAAGDAQALLAARFSLGLGQPEPLPPPRAGHVAALAFALGLALLAIAASGGALRGALRWSAGAMRFCWESCLRIWRDMAPGERWSLLLLLGAGTAARLWEAATAAATLDEAITGLLFVDRGPLVALVWYPVPNNHVAHSMLAAAAAWLPIDLLLAMRLPAVAAAGAAQVVMHLLLRRIAGPAAALLGTGAFMASFPFLHYDHLARGYALTVLCMALAFGAGLAWLRSGDERPLRVLVFAGVLGLFALPSFLYALSALFVGVLVLRPYGAAPVLRAALLIAAGALLCYLPAAVVSGPAALVANPYVRPAGLQFVAGHWPSHWRRVFEGIMGMRHGAWAAAGVLLLAAWRARAPGRAAARLAALMVMVSLLIPFAHRTIPFERTWIHLLVPVWAAFALLADSALARIPARRAWLMLFPIAGWWAWQQARHAAALDRFDPEVARAARSCAAIREQAPKRVLSTAMPLGAYAAFDLRRRGAWAQIEFGPAGTLPGPAHDLFIGSGGASPPGPGWVLLSPDEGEGAAWARRAR